MLRKMVSEKCEYVVIEVSSHAMDQNRLWGVNIDTAVLTNIYDNEHLDYHGTFVDYLKSKENKLKAKYCISEKIIAKQIMGENARKFLKKNY